MWDCPAPAAADTRVHLTRSVATEQNWLTTASGVWWSVFTRLLSETSVSWNSVSSTLGQVCLRTSSTSQLTSGKCNYERVWRPTDTTLSIFCIKTGSFPKEICMRYFWYAVWETTTWQQATYVKTEAYHLYARVFEYFCQTLSKLIVIILSYTVSKLVNFLRHSVVCVVITILSHPL